MLILIFSEMLRTECYLVFVVLLECYFVAVDQNFKRRRYSYLCSYDVAANCLLTDYQISLLRHK